MISNKGIKSIYHDFRVGRTVVVICVERKAYKKLKIIAGIFVMRVGLRISGYSSHIRKVK